LKVLKKTDRVVLDGEGLTKIKKHLKPSQVNPDGGIIEIEKPIHVSNVMLIDPKEKTRTRIGYKTVTESNKKDSVTKKVRYAKKSGKELN
jgi:large subunit ribosomal protein L24